MIFIDSSALITHNHNTNNPLATAAQYTMPALPTMYGTMECSMARYVCVCVRTVTI